MWPAKACWRARGNLDRSVAQVLENLVVGRFCMCQEAGRRMLRAGRGSIVNIGSLASITRFGARPRRLQHGDGGRGADDARTEHRMGRLGRARQRDPAGAGRQPEPGTADGGRPCHEHVWLRGIPAGRLGQPDDIRGLAVLLASDASSWITGALIPMDGGNLAMNGGGSIRGAAQ